MELIALVKACLAKDSKAQYQLYQYLAPKMLGVCMRYAKDQSEAEDFMQEGFIRMFMKLEQYKFDGVFEGWVRRIMVNTSLEILRSQLKHANHQDIDDVSYELGKDEDIMSQLSMKELMKIVQSLSPMYRAVFNLYVFEGYKHKEIAQELGVSEGTSKSNLSAARNILKEKVSKLYQE